MKPVKLICGAALAAGLAFGIPAWAHDGGHWHDGWHGHWHPRVGVVIGGYWPWYDPFYYPPVVTVPVPVAPPTYVEQTVPPGGAPGYWYYCRGAQRYYPYVRSCPGGWEQVVPTPPE